MNDNIKIGKEGLVESKPISPDNQKMLKLEKENEELKELVTGVASVTKLTILSIRIAITFGFISIFGIILSSYFSIKEENKNICNYHHVRFFNN